VISQAFGRHIVVISAIDADRRFIVDGRLVFLEGEAVLSDLFVDLASGVDVDSDGCLVFGHLLLANKR
jgi:hypothetical protein